MDLKIIINLDNAAFGDGNTGNEAGRILQGLANRMIGRELDAGDGYILKDVNGNRVGEAVVVRKAS